MQSTDSPYATLRIRYDFLPKDFVEAGDGVLCAIVAEGSEEQRVLVTPRYQRQPDGQLMKLSTKDANDLVRQHYPRWVYHSPSRDIVLPAIPLNELQHVYRPTEQWPELLDRADRWSAVFRQLALLLKPLLANIGITGSHLAGAARAGSDIDLVAYGLTTFSQAQELLCQAAYFSSQAPPPLSELSESQWFESFVRRGCSDLTFAEYLWHEQRKRNKFSVDGIKIDLSCVDKPHWAVRNAGLKLGRVRAAGKVLDDTYAFTSPAVFALDHPTIKNIVVHTATYVGQAQVGELIEACGSLEVESNGAHRLVIGASREADGEFLKVVRGATSRSQLE